MNFHIICERIKKLYPNAVSVEISEHWGLTIIGFSKPYQTYIIHLSVFDNGKKVQDINFISYEILIRYIEFMESAKEKLIDKKDSYLSEAEFRRMYGEL